MSNNPPNYQPYAPYAPQYGYSYPPPTHSYQRPRGGSPAQGYPTQYQYYPYQQHPGYPNPHFYPPHTSPTPTPSPSPQPTQQKKNIKIKVTTAEGSIPTFLAKDTTSEPQQQAVTSNSVLPEKKKITVSAAPLSSVSNSAVSPASSNSDLQVDKNNHHDAKDEVKNGVNDDADSKEIASEQEGKENQSPLQSDANIPIHENHVKLADDQTRDLPVDSDNNNNNNSNTPADNTNDDDSNNNNSKHIASLDIQSPSEEEKSSENKVESENQEDSSVSRDFLEREIKEEKSELPVVEIDEDSWENRREEDIADLQNPDNNDENFDPNRGVSRWQPDNEDGERIYGFDFLFSFQGLCIKKPEEMADFDINVEYHRSSHGRGSFRGGRSRDFSGPPRGSPKSPSRHGGRDDHRGYPNKKGYRGPPDSPVNPSLKKKDSLSKVDQVLKTATGLLNKLTFEKFESLSEKIVDVGIDEETLEPIIKLVFEKAVSEPKYSTMYTKLCKILSVKYPTYQRNGETISFRRILLNKCQEEFENKKKIADPDSLSKEELEELDFKIRLRMKGNITFIGELFKEKMLNDQIIHYCVNHLLGDVNNPDPANIEGLCRFFTTIGKMLDSEKNKEKIDRYFEKMRFIKNNTNLSVRIKYAIEDVFDLRRDKWVPRRADEAPDTIKAVHKNIESKQSSQAPSSPHRGKDKRGGSQNSNPNLSNKEYRKVEHSNSNNNLYNNNNINNNNFSAKKLQPEKKFNQYAILQTSSPSSSPLSSPMNSPRREVSSQPSTPSRDLSEKEMKNLLYNSIDEFISNKTFEIDDFRDIKTDSINVIFETLLHLIKKNLDAENIGSLFLSFISSNYITLNYFADGLNKILEEYEDYAEDFPKLSSRIAVILLRIIKSYPLAQIVEADKSNLILPFLSSRSEIRAQFADLISELKRD